MRSLPPVPSFEADRHQVLYLEHALEQLLDGRDSAVRLARLTARHPWHPLLVGWHLGLAGAILSGVGFLATVLAPHGSREIAQLLAYLEASVGPVPSAWTTLMAALLLLAYTCRLAAAERGSQVELLPWEKEEHRDLMLRLTNLRGRAKQSNSW